MFLFEFTAGLFEGSVRSLKYFLLNKVPTNLSHFSKQFPKYLRSSPIQRENVYQTPADFIHE